MELKVSALTSSLPSSLLLLKNSFHGYRVASTVTYPFQVMKSRMQQPSSSIELTSTGDVRVVKRDYTGMVATVRKIFQQEGLSGFFKGAIPNAVRVAPNAAVTFVIYEAVMDTLQ
jgi:solute carrier family 25 folate transporter 32